MTAVTDLLPRMQSKIRMELCDTPGLSPFCWAWTGSRKKGYGRIKFARKLAYSHRVSYQMLVGSIPDGMEIDHLCRNRPCCNPEHLEVVTRTENQRRSEPQTRTHCKRAGHPLSGDNLGIYINKKKGHRSRRCRACLRDRYLRLNPEAGAPSRVATRRLPSTGFAADLSDPRHGTVNGYGNLRCRCERCKAAGSERNRQGKQRRCEQPTPDHVHGTVNGYTNYRCRCASCKAAMSR